MKQDYPYNLARSIFRLPKNTPIEDLNLHEDFEHVMEDLIQTNLSERHAAVIKYRFQEGLTLRDVGIVIGRTAEAVRPIEKSAIIKLRASRSKITKTLITNEISDINVIDSDLTTHSINCLMRAGITTLKQVAALPISELLKIRNLGRVAVLDIVKCLERYGLLTDALKKECEIVFKEDVKNEY